MRKHNYIETTDEKSQEELMTIVRRLLGSGINAWQVNDSKEKLVDDLQDDII